VFDGKWVGALTERASCHAAGRKGIADARTVTHKVCP
jgi:hypothetical protein